MRQRDKSDLPLPILSYKYFLLEYSFPTLSFYSPKLTSPAAAPPKVSKISNDGLSPPTPKVFDRLPCEEMAINFAVPEVSSPSHLLYFYHILVHPQFILLNIPLLFLLFFFLSLKTSRICPIRLSSLPINHTSNVSTH